MINIDQKNENENPDKQNTSNNKPPTLSPFPLALPSEKININKIDTTNILNLLDLIRDKTFKHKELMLLTILILAIMGLIVS